MFNRQTSIAMRLIRIICFTVGMSMLIAVTGLTQIKRLSTQLDNIVNIHSSRGDAAAQLLSEIGVIAGRSYMVTLLLNPKDVAAETSSFTAAVERYRTIESGLARELGNGSQITPEEMQIFNTVQDVSRLGLALYIEAAKLGTEGTSAATQLLIDRARPAEMQWRRQLSEMVVLEYRLKQEAYAEAVAMQTTAIVLIIGCAVASVLIGALLAWHAIRRVTGPIQRAIELSERIAEGDLFTVIDIQGDTEVSRLLQALSSMQRALSDVVGQVRNATESIGTASTDIAMGNFDLSQRTERAASRLQEIASSMHQLTSAVQETANSAVKANSLASMAGEVAGRGEHVMNSVGTTMEEITTSSRRIAEIIGSIDGIAFQTNILALNAAVEAARAGEHGRGFAVVAGEVRSLAQKAGDAAKEIRELIGLNVERVASGGELVKHAGATMLGIVASVHKVSAVIAEISAATTRQSDDIEQVNCAIGQLDGVTQQNAALVEESTAAAASLEDQSKCLRQVVSSFRLDEFRTTLISNIEEKVVFHHLQNG